MKKKHQLIICVLFMVLANNAIILKGAGLEYFVAPQGDDANPGTRSKPFATVQAARDAIRRLERKPGKFDSITVHLRAGVYLLNSTLEIKEKDSGCAKVPVVYQACPGETVRLIGGKEFPASLLEPVRDKKVLERLINTKAKNNLKQLNLRALGITDFGVMKHRGFCRPYENAPLEVFYNHQPLSPTCFPKEKWLRIRKVLNNGSKPRYGDFSDRGGIFLYEGDRPRLWKDYTDIWVHGMFGTVWADDTLKVASLDPQERKITTSEPHLYGITSGHFRFQNILEEIGTPGEYYVDRKNGMLYLWPPEQQAQATLSVSLLESPLVAMEGASFVHFKNIVFEVTRGIGIYIEKGQGNRLLGCTIRNVGSVGVSIGKGVRPFASLRHEFISEPAARILGNLREHQYADIAYNRQAGKNHGLIACNIYNCGAGGVSLGGGDRKTLTPAGNFVENCHIHHTNRLEKTYRPCVDISGVGNRVSNCLMHDATHSAIIFYGNDHIMEYNRIYDVILESDDGGAFYTGRDPSSYGNVIRYNFVYKAGSTNPLYRHGYWHAVYLDDFACGVTVEKNIFVDNNVGTLASGWDTKVNNNIIVNSPRPNVFQFRRFQPEAKKRIELMRVDKPPYSERYPTIKDRAEKHAKPGQCAGSESRRNISIGSNKPCVILDRVNNDLIDVDNNLDVKEKAQFSDLSEKDFILKVNSLGLKNIRDFEPIPLEKIGLYLDTWRRELPRTKSGIAVPSEN